MDNSVSSSNENIIPIEENKKPNDREGKPPTDSWYGFNDKNIKWNDKGQEAKAALTKTIDGKTVQYSQKDDIPQPKPTPKTEDSAKNGKSNKGKKEKKTK